LFFEEGFVVCLEFDREDTTALIFTLPVLAAVNVPVFAEGRREGFGEEQERDNVAPWS
jgi:hypothetical protein